ncbi:MAG TPA: DUF6272 family protein [Cyclobacteriaceae bacterium]|nr:hypothetical protein [Cyclobacteriaceae bacterium]HMV09032.1 DUF6272 family protein [Cyclobacteriaceae bacterium]HMV89876.1 DUF6272 family protein [Cyclobacteriaceae bacterium]HMW99563.1 DUF6272 family protein [Cyclobacteriaceae bacterium]HMX51654.1 DUF6272 family protein [Cyclobacteriaceae bacterium]
MLVYTIDLSREINEGFFYKLKQFGDGRLTVTKRVTEITLELLQNIRSHGNGLTHASLSIIKHESGFTWQSVNGVSSNVVKPLSEKIHHINTLSGAELQQQHKQILANSKHIQAINPGLGLYRIALRSQSKLRASFKPLGSALSTFSLDINLATHS